jgi:hypothetical protein
MRVLGVCTSPEDIKWALASGTNDAPHLEGTDRKSQRLPDSEDETLKLIGLVRFVSTLLKEKQVEKVVIASAGYSPFRGPSPARVKVECAVQLAAAEIGLPAELVAAATLRAKEKRLVEETGHSPEELLNQSKEFSPRAWRDAAIAAWVGLPK